MSEEKTRKFVPYNIRRHKELCKELHETYVKKNRDYGNSFSETFERLGPISAITRISDKYNRLVNLATKAEALVTDESIMDTAKDMANYCLMFVQELEKQEYKKNQNQKKEGEVEE